MSSCTSKLAIENNLTGEEVEESSSSLDQLTLLDLSNKLTFNLSKGSNSLSIDGVTSSLNNKKGLAQDLNIEIKNIDYNLKHLKIALYHLDNCLEENKVTEEKIVGDSLLRDVSLNFGTNKFSIKLSNDDNSLSLCKEDPSLNYHRVKVNSSLQLIAGNLKSEFSLNDNITVTAQGYYHTSTSPTR